MKFENKAVNSEKLIQYGFLKVNGKFVYTTEIFENQFKMTVTIDESGDIATKLLDLAAEEVYTLHLVAEASGEFVGRVRTEYQYVLQNIVNNCFDSTVFKESCANKVIEYAREKYGDEPEFLWEKFPDTAVLRRKDSKKWYAIVMTVSKSKLGLSGSNAVEIIDLRCDVDELPKAVDGVGYFPGYHMNKKHWITILLDGTVPTEEILTHIDSSYRLAK